MGRVKDFVNDLTSGCPHFLVVREENPLDSSTPLDQPLTVSGWGFNAKGITYNVKGFDQISTIEEDQYYILSNAEGCWVIRKNLKHEKLYSEKTINYMLDFYVDD